MAGWPTLTDALAIAEVRTLLGEPVERRVTDTQITKWINEAMLIICRRNMAYESTTQVKCVAGTASYTISNCLGVAAVYYSGQAATPCLGSDTLRSLLRMHPRHFANLQGATWAIPQEYFWFQTKLYVWPPPSTVNYLEVFFYEVPSSFGTDEFVNLPLHYQAYVVWFAYAMALKKLGKMQQAYQYMSYFNNFIDFHKQNELIKPVDSQDMMGLPDTTQYV